jgi:hypothetical protein
MPRAAPSSPAAAALGAVRHMTPARHAAEKIVGLLNCILFLPSETPSQPLPAEGAP